MRHCGLPVCLPLSEVVDLTVLPRLILNLESQIHVCLPPPTPCPSQAAWTTGAAAAVSLNLRSVVMYNYNVLESMRLVRCWARITGLSTGNKDEGATRETHREKCNILHTQHFMYSYLILTGAL